MNFKHGHTSKHGYTSKTYYAWASMKKRCDWKGYCKERGLTYCEEWKEFKNFLDDMGEAPEGMSLDRIDNDKGYSKENCRWTTVKVQQNNTRQNVLVTYNNKTQTIAQWCEELGLDSNRIRARIRRGLPIEKVMYPGKLPIRE